jgi:hypothetical protein
MAWHDPPDSGDGRRHSPPQVFAVVWELFQSAMKRPYSTVLKRRHRYIKMNGGLLLLAFEIQTYT